MDADDIISKGFLRDYIEAHNRRDSDTRLYIRILNGDPYPGMEAEKERVARIVDNWISNRMQLEEDLALLNQVTTTTYSEIQPDLSVKRYQKTCPISPTLNPYPYMEIAEAMQSGKERGKPHICEECEKWFVPAPKGPIKYCSRGCSQKNSNRENSDRIKASVREGRKRGDYL